MRKSLWIVVGAVVACGGSMFSGFHFDDYGMLQDPAVVSLGNWTLWQTRPLTWFTFWLNYQISGRNPILWHAVNLALHVACAVLLYRLLMRFLPKAALFGALIFAVHPMQSEAVDYVYARAIVLSTLFCILAMDAWTRERPWRSVAWFTLAVLSKEECVSLPMVLALYSLILRAKPLPHGRGSEAAPNRRGAGENGCAAGQTTENDGLPHGRAEGLLHIPMAAMCGVALLSGLRVIAAIHATGMKNIGANAGISPAGYLSEQGIAILRYFGLLIFPWFFSVDPLIPTPPWIWRMLAWLVVLSLTVLAARRVRKVPAAFCLLAGFILLIPSSSIFPAADLAADRRMYLPMLAFAPAMALMIPARHVLVAAVLAALSIGRAYVWASDERLWSEAAAQAPDKIRPILQLSRAIAPDRAAELLQRAEAANPNDPDIPGELARIDLELNRPADALAQAGRALALAPRDPHALNNRGAVLLALNQTAAARGDFLAALRIDPCLSEARENLERSGGIPADAPRCPR